jgi:hypothetical protein
MGPEQRGWGQGSRIGETTGDRMITTAPTNKPFQIDKRLVYEAVQVSVPGDGGDSAGAAGTGGGVAGRRPSDRSAMVEMWNFTQAERGPNG